MVLKSQSQLNSEADARDALATVKGFTMQPLTPTGYESHEAPATEHHYDHDATWDQHQGWEHGHEHYEGAEHHDPDHEDHSKIKQLFGQNPCCCAIQRGFCVMVVMDVIVCLAVSIILLLDLLREQLAILRCHPLREDEHRTKEEEACNVINFQTVDIFVLSLYYTTVTFSFIMDTLSWLCPDQGRGFVLILSKIFQVIALLVLGGLFAIKGLAFRHLSHNLRAYFMVCGAIFAFFGMLEIYFAWIAFAYSLHYKAHRGEDANKGWFQGNQVGPHPHPPSDATYVNKIEINKIERKHKSHSHHRHHHHRSENSIPSDHELNQHHHHHRSGKSFSDVELNKHPQRSGKLLSDFELNKSHHRSGKSPSDIEYHFDKSKSQKNTGKDQGKDKHSKDQSHRPTTM